MLLNRKITKNQPQCVPGINWANPLTQGLIGLIWTGGPGGPVDIVFQPFSLSTTNVTITPKSKGNASVVTVPSSSGVYSNRNDYGQWKIASPPFTFAALFDYVTPASSRPEVGCVQGNLGYGFWDLYGLRNRLASVYIGGSRKDVSSGVWNSGPGVRAMTVTDTNLIGYDGGIQFASTTYASSTSITYDNTYGRLYALGSPDNASSAGEVYWMAVWNRVLSPNEINSVSKDPWQLFFSSAFSMYGYISSGGSFTKTLDDTTTITDILYRQTGKDSIETITLTDTIRKSVSRVLSDTANITDTVDKIKVAVKAILDTTTLTDSFLKTASKVMSETITATDILRRSIGRTVSETITLLDSVIKSVGRAFTEIATITDAALSAIKVTAKALSDTVTFTDLYIKNIAKILGDAITFSDTLNKSFSRLLSEITNLIDTVTPEKVSGLITKTLSDTVTMVDTLVKRTSKLFLETVGLTDSYIKQFYRTYQEVITATDSLLAEIVIAPVGRVIRVGKLILTSDIKIGATVVTRMKKIAKSVITTINNA